MHSDVDADKATLFYALPFERNPDWSGLYVYSHKIQGYFERFCGKERFRNDREYESISNTVKDIEGQTGEDFGMLLRDRSLNVRIKAIIKAQMPQWIGPGHDELKEKTHSVVVARLP
jgi:hypothetical protein